MITEILKSFAGGAGSGLTSPAASTANQRSNTDNYIATGTKIFGASNPNAEYAFDSGMLTGVTNPAGLRPQAYAVPIIAIGAVILAYIYLKKQK